MRLPMQSAPIRAGAQRRAAGLTPSYLTDDMGFADGVAYLQPPDSETPQDCMLDCVTECLEAGGSQPACSNQCRRRCRPNLPPYECTPRDNSVNRNLCLGAMWAWEQVCNAECNLLGSTVVGPSGVAICRAACGALANRMRGDCSPATICV